jgi:Tfp pilus assembly pilus retraction ATPase PilT
MDRLQRMAEYARKQKGKGIVLRGNDTCVLLGERGRQPLNKVMTPEEIEALLGEAAPPDVAPRLGEAGPLTFTHPTAEGEATVRVTRAGGRLEVVIALPGEALPEPDPTAPVAAPPPAVYAVPGSPAVTGAGGLAPVVPAAPPLEVPPLVVLPDPTRRPAVEFPRDYLPGLFRAALAVPASDVYLQAGSRPWARVQGEVHRLDYGNALSPDQLQAALFDLIPLERRGQWLEGGAVEFALTFEDRARVRCALLADTRGVGASCRLLPLAPPSLSELQAPSSVADLARAERGLVLVGGARSSGVTTTLAALVAAIGAERRARVVTVEAPVEYLYRPGRSLLSQVEVPTQAPSVAEALRRTALAGADVCAVGDVTDPQALAAALALAEGGLLVLAALRLGDVPAVVERLGEAAGARHAAERVVRVLRGVVCQRLCRPRHPGRLIPLFEVLTVSPTAAALVRQGKFRELQGAMFTTFDTALVGLIKDEKITRDEALRQASDPEAVRRLLPA